MEGEGQGVSASDVLDEGTTGTGTGLFRDTQSQEEGEQVSVSQPSGRRERRDVAVQTDRHLFVQSLASCLAGDAGEFLLALRELVPEGLEETAGATEQQQESGDGDGKKEEKEDAEKNPMRVLVEALDRLGGAPHKAPKLSACSFGCGMVGSGRDVKKHERRCPVQRDARRADKHGSKKLSIRIRPSDEGHAMQAPQAAASSLLNKPKTSPPSLSLAPTVSVSAGVREPPLVQFAGPSSACAVDVTAHPTPATTAPLRQSPAHPSILRGQEDGSAGGAREQHSREDRRGREGGEERRDLFAWHPDVLRFGVSVPDNAHPSSATFTKSRHNRSLSLVYEQNVRRGGVHAYRFSVLKGEMVAGDGVSFVFGSRVPATRNLKNLNALLLSSNGHVCVRVEGGSSRQMDTASLPKVERGSEVAMTIDLDQAKALIEVVTQAPTEGGRETERLSSLHPRPPSCTLRVYRSVVDFKFLRVPSRLSGHFCCLITNTDTTVSVGQTVASNVGGIQGTANTGQAAAAAAAAAVRVGVSSPVLAASPPSHLAQATRTVREERNAEAPNVSLFSGRTPTHPVSSSSTSFHRPVEPLTSTGSWPGRNDGVRRNDEVRGGSGFLADGEEAPSASQPVHAAGTQTQQQQQQQLPILVPVVSCGSADGQPTTSFLVLQPSGDGGVVPAQIDRSEIERALQHLMIQQQEQEQYQGQAEGRTRSVHGNANPRGTLALVQGWPSDMAPSQSSPTASGGSLSVSVPPNSGDSSALPTALLQQQQVEQQRVERQLDAQPPTSSGAPALLPEPVQAIPLVTPGGVVSPHMTTSGVRMVREPPQDSFERRPQGQHHQSGFRPSSSSSSSSASSSSAFPIPAPPPSPSSVTTRIPYLQQQQEQRLTPLQPLPQIRGDGPVPNFFPPQPSQRSERRAAPPIPPPLERPEGHVGAWGPPGLFPFPPPSGMLRQQSHHTKEKQQVPVSLQGVGNPRDVQRDVHPEFLLAHERASESGPPAGPPLLQQQYSQLGEREDRDASTVLHDPLFRSDRRG
uniref:Uncharacterized protein n=1 Tax=Chromera velia CCMP2878 TaxID=1169474 RepID=A0A0G4H2Q5_9ALVE|eukprot:Cvel_24469.t1-p1 / transcript=Cvel_24469.t1 / gene=Cvel_24469 / organism=Chromera_velia_CCMP2878 / gene_product=hypothetical protein / transcript_product=hypothetical protein / location=Cvel_scaffold2648:6602-12557(-) / protein_length=1028 / sequence_SO=supercontig / SO=protein_coding / is_pseudo=false